MEQDRLRSLFDTLSKKENSGRRQLVLLREYMKQRDSPETLAAFVDKVESEVVSGVPVSVKKEQEQVIKPSITKTSVLTNTNLEARRQKVAALKAKKEAADAAKAAEVAEAAKAAKEAANKKASDNAAEVAEAAKAAKEAANKKASDNAAAAAKAAKATKEAVDAAKAAEIAEAAKAAKEAANKTASDNAAEATEEEVDEEDEIFVEEEEVDVEQKEDLLDPDVLYTRDEPLLDGDNNKAVVVRETLAQGDCFFSAIFRSSVEGDFYEDMITCLGIEDNEEDPEMNFVKQFRQKLAEELRKGRLPYAEGEMNNDGNPKDVYTHLVNLFETTVITGEILENTDYYQVALPQPTWLQKALLTDLLIGEKVMVQDLQTKKPVRKTKIKERKRDTFYTREEFLSLLIANIETSQSYVAEIEVRITRRLLRACGIKLVIYNTISEETVPAKGMLDEKEVPRINLVNKQEGHYEYYSFITDDEQAIFSGGFVPPKGGGAMKTKSKKRFDLTPKRKARKGEKKTRKLYSSLENSSFLKGFISIRM
jgi:flagellar biosynthesis GTPase FlhF